MIVRREKIQSLKDIRKEVGLTTYDLSKLTGVSQSYISQIENNYRSLTGKVVLGAIYMRLAYEVGKEDLLTEEVLKSGHSEKN